MIVSVLGTVSLLLLTACTGAGAPTTGSTSVGAGASSRAGSAASASGAGATPAGSAADAEYRFGEVVEVAPQALMVVGRELDAQKGEADVANSILYKKDDVVYWIDSGATPAFARALRGAFSRLEPYRKVVLVNTHGHIEHVGNNALLNQVGAQSVEHWIPAAEIDKARHYLEYFTNAFTPIAPYIESFADPAAGAAGLMKLFEPVDVETGVMTPLEALPQQAFDIGETAWTGWDLGGGAVQLLRAQGHTEGEVVVYIPGIKLLHVGDEDNGYYPAFPGHDLVKTEVMYEKTRSMVKNGAVDMFTDGHSFVVRDAEQAEAFLDNRLDSAIAFDAAMHRILAEHPEGITVPDLVVEFQRAPELAEAGGGAQHALLVDTMVIMNKLRELGVAPTGNGPNALVMPPAAS